MKKEIIPSVNGYGISCINNLSGKEKTVVIVSHGFGSSKESPTAQAVLEALPKYGVGVFAFDFPAHGESPANGEMLRVKNCLDDISDAEAYVQSLAPNAEISYFSSSFGAYIALIYISNRKPAGKRFFLRCAAVNMPDLFRQGLTLEQRAGLDSQGFFSLETDYGRSLKITREFISDLEAHDVFKLYRPGVAELAMIHGTADETVPVESARRFAEISGAKFTEVQGADHRFLIPGGTRLVVETAIDFFTAQAK